MMNPSILKKRHSLACNSSSSLRCQFPDLFLSSKEQIEKQYFFVNKINLK